MFVRNLLLAVGILCLLGGIALSVVWFNQSESNTAQAPTAVRPAILIAKHSVPAGTLLRPEDIGWKEIGPNETRAGNLMRGQVSETEFVGAITRREFAADEPLVSSDLVKPNERQFLAAVLKPGNRAVTISVDAPQSAAGLILPGDQVDIILTQSFGDSMADPAHKSVAETVLRDVRVIAVDQSLSTVAKPVISPRALTGEARVPKTVTFEVTPRQAERLYVAAHLGRLQLAVRPLEVRSTADTGQKHELGPTWASQVSPALGELDPKTPQFGSSVWSSVRRPPVLSP